MSRCRGRVPDTSTILFAVFVFGLTTIIAVVFTAAGVNLP